MAEARSRLDDARFNLDASRLGIAASAAYYAMLYAARAALSERDLYAKTHSGVWSAFGAEFVASGSFTPELAQVAARAQRIRELGDYEAKPPSGAEAAALVEDAERFVDAVLGLLDG